MAEQILAAGRLQRRGAVEGLPPGVTKATLRRRCRAGAFGCAAESMPFIVWKNNLRKESRPGVVFTWGSRLATTPTGAEDRCRSTIYNRNISPGLQTNAIDLLLKR